MFLKKARDSAYCVMPVSNNNAEKSLSLKILNSANE